MRLFEIAWKKLKHRLRTESRKKYKWTVKSGCKIVFCFTLETTNGLTRIPGLFGQPAADRKATLIVCPMSVLSNWTVSVAVICLWLFCLIGGLTFTSLKLEQPYNLWRSAMVLVRPEDSQESPRKWRELTHKISFSIQGFGTNHSM